MGDVRFSKGIRSAGEAIQQAEKDIREGATKIQVGKDIKGKVHVASYLRAKHRSVDVEINEREYGLESEFVKDTPMRKKYQKPQKLSSRKFFDMGRK